MRGGGGARNCTCHGVLCSQRSIPEKNSILSFFWEKQGALAQSKYRNSKMLVDEYIIIVITIVFFEIICDC